MLPDLATRRKICEDTIKRSSHITTTTPGASLSSTFIDLTIYPELSPLDPLFPDLSLSTIKVIDSDTFACARAMLATSPNLRGKVAVLNLASDEEPGGGWRCPELTEDKKEFKEERVLEEFRDKVRLVLRCAAREGKTGLVLGALGCGAYRCPPMLVAIEMKGVLKEEEFRGWFERVDFAVYGKGPIGERNLRVFREVFGEQD
ncbi:hypothetical protein E4T52_07553 [Aureobasidium sp. EXF-3400]|nr:hypothetical protein E4T51_06419 [Aureobasidium sp. EXF-12344]KAI4777485.1 hypothetical protein E4T52_07553 [Aureobasidium sp. EXF-3400]